MIMSIITVELLFAILVLGIVCGQLKNVRLFPGEYQRTLERHDAGQEENHEMIFLSRRDSDNDSLLTTTDI